MKAIIAIVCKGEESMRFFYFPVMVYKKMKFSKNDLICYIEKENLPDARAYIAFDLIEERHISRKERDLILAGKKDEIDFKDLNISIRTGTSMKSFIKYYNSLH